MYNTEPGPSKRRPIREEAHHPYIRPSSQPPKARSVALQPMNLTRTSDQEPPFNAESMTPLLDNSANNTHSNSKPSIYSVPGPSWALPSTSMFTPDISRGTRNMQPVHEASPTGSRFYDDPLDYSMSPQSGTFPQNRDHPIDYCTEPKPYPGATSTITSARAPSPRAPDNEAGRTELRTYPGKISMKISARASSADNGSARTEFKTYPGKTTVKISSRDPSIDNGSGRTLQAYEEPIASTSRDPGYDTELYQEHQHSPENSSFAFDTSKATLAANNEVVIQQHKEDVVAGRDESAEVFGTLMATHLKKLKGAARRKAEKQLFDCLDNVRSQSWNNENNIGDNKQEPIEVIDLDSTGGEDQLYESSLETEVSSHTQPPMREQDSPNVNTEREQTIQEELQFEQNCSPERHFDEEVTQHSYPHQQIDEEALQYSHPRQQYDEEATQHFYLQQQYDERESLQDFPEQQLDEPAQPHSFVDEFNERTPSQSLQTQQISKGQSLHTSLPTQQYDERTPSQSLPAQQFNEQAPSKILKVQPFNEQTNSQPLPNRQTNDRALPQVLRTPPQFNRGFWSNTVPIQQFNEQALPMTWPTQQFDRPVPSRAFGTQQFNLRMPSQILPTQLFHGRAPYSQSLPTQQFYERTPSYQHSAQQFTRQLPAYEFLNEQPNEHVTLEQYMAYQYGEQAAHFQFMAQNFNTQALPRQFPAPQAASSQQWLNFLYHAYFLDDTPPTIVTDINLSLIQTQQSMGRLSVSSCHSLFGDPKLKPQDPFFKASISCALRPGFTPIRDRNGQLYHTNGRIIMPGNFDATDFKFIF